MTSEPDWKPPQDVHGLPSVMYDRDATAESTHVIISRAELAQLRRAPSEAVGLLREVVVLWDADTFDIPIGDLDKTVDKIRRFLAAQEGT